MSRGTSILAILAVAGFPVGAALLSLSCFSPSGGLKKSVILITIDTLRADHLSLYGYPLSTSPNLDKFAALGTVHRNAHSTSPCTAPSHASILTGQYPSFHTVGSSNGRQRLSPEMETVAEILKRNGYTTAAVVSNPVLTSHLGLDQGFDIYDDHMTGKELSRNKKQQSADVAVNKALAVLRGFGERPFFLWLHLQDPHGPYTPPADFEWNGSSNELEAEKVLPVGDDHSGYRSIPRYQVFYGSRRYSEYVRRYDQEIAFTDQELGRFFEYLEAHGFLNQGLVAITADHGEAMGEDDFYFSHCNSVGIDQVHVPMILAGSGITAGHDIEQPVSNAALFRTILDFTGLSEEGNSPLDGLLSTSGTDGADDARFVPTYLESLNQVGLVADNVLIRWDRHPETDGEFWAAGNPNAQSFWKPLGKEVVQLFHPSTPRSATDLDHLERLLREYQAAAAASERRLDGIRQTTRLPRAVERALKSLGYLQ